MAETKLKVKQAMQNQVKARAYLSSAQGISANTPTTVQLDTENYDIGSDFNTGTYTFTVPVTGYYLIVANVGYAVAADGDNLQAYIHVNGTAVATAKTQAGGGIDEYLTVSTIEYLTATNTVTLVAYNGTNADTVRAGTDDTYLAIHLLSV